MERGGKKDRARARWRGNTGRGKGRTKGGKEEDKKKKDKLRAYVLVSSTLDEQMILLLYRRVDVYLIAIRDVKKRWWKFSVNGLNTLFDGALLQPDPISGRVWVYFFCPA